MKKAYISLAAALAVIANAAGVASAEGGRSAHAASAPTVQLRHTHLGNILVNGSGHTLYEFTRDHGARNSCVSISGCSRIWPWLAASPHPTAGAGVKSSALSSISVPGGRQVTYDGHPLYTYSGDRSAGETSYVGVSAFGGSWFALNASAQAVR